MEEFQLTQLRDLLQHAYRNVPYYKNLFEERELDPYKFKDINELRKLPFLTKDIVRTNLKDLLAENYSQSKIESVMTGGTTDVPLCFYHEKKRADSREDAFILNLWERVGFRFGDKRVSIRGAVPRASKKFWNYDPVRKNLILSSLDMTDALLQEYVSIIREFQPDFFHVYPSVITVLAKYMKKKEEPPFENIKAILCCSEMLYPCQRILLEEVFQCRVYSWYGHAERAVLAGECEKNTDYHIFPEYGITELIDGQDMLIEKANQAGEIVATGFNNYVLPFIRYKTGDLAVLSEQNCRCGREYPLLKKVIGREQEYFVDKSSCLITFIWADKPLWDFRNKIHGYQYIQNNPGEILLKIDANEYLYPSDIEQIKNDFQDLYKNLTLRIEICDDIIRTKSGKMKYLIQNIPIEVCTDA